MISFPETFFFALATPRRRVVRDLGFSSREAPKAYQKLEELGLRSHTAAVPRRLKNCALDFVSSLDHAASTAGKRVWIEKTPIHLRYIRYIDHHVTGASFVHIIRNGTGAIPSLYEVTGKFPDDWDGARSLQQCIDRWQEDLRLSAAQTECPNHVFVSYERLVDHPEVVLGSLCEFLSLPTDRVTLEGMLDGRSETLGRVVQDEPWKEGVAKAIVNSDIDKLDQRLSPAQRDRVLDAVARSQSTLDRISVL